ncbi:MAG: GIY-YIG nuclease family protein [Alphaproteobacteria bacterium]|nr:GIY-YIG nuclease family protein [Alphaproteobacteria bacterium]
MTTTKRSAVYIVASERNGTLYTGVTSELVRRIAEHRESAVPGFAQRYGYKVLVWFEMHDEMSAAIAREKQVKAGSRGKKLAPIEATNSDWRDFYAEIIR